MDKKKIMIARKINDSIEISFKYDPALVSLIKSLEGRRYDPHSKNWTIPLAGALPVMEKLARRGFAVEPVLWDEIRRDQERAQEVEALAVLPDTEFSIPLPLYSFQRVCSAFMVKTGSCLNACGVGTGKTLMALAATFKNGTKKNLVVAPKSLLLQWEQEIFKWVPQYKTFVVSGNLGQRKVIYEQVKKCEDYFFLIISYDTIKIDREVIENI